MAYRVVFDFVTSGQQIVEMTSDWVPYRDVAEEIVESNRPYHNEAMSFANWRIEERKVLEENRA